MTLPRGITRTKHWLRHLLTLGGFALTAALPACATPRKPQALPAVPAHSGVAGFETLSIPNGDEPPLRVGVWYPSKGQAVDQHLADFRQRVVLGGKVIGRRLPLIVMSHGGGGSFTGHYDTALTLAQAGFVVAAVNHAGDMTGDDSKVLQLWRRPRQLTRTISYMIDAWRGGGRIDAHRVGAYGFSNGGFTVLTAAGGRPDLALIDPYCHANPKQDLCAALAAGGISRVSDLPMPADAWSKDGRIRAIAVAAPGFAPVFEHGGLKDVTIPVQLWYGSDDQHQPGPWYGELVLRELPRRPELHVVAGAGHYDFLAPCPASMAAAVPLICSESNGFDQGSFHRELNQGLVQFFSRALPRG